MICVCSHLVSTQKPLKLTHLPQCTCEKKNTQRMKISTGNSLKTHSLKHLTCTHWHWCTSESAGHRRPCSRPTLSTDRIRLDQNMPFKQAGPETHTLTRAQLRLWPWEQLAWLVRPELHTETALHNHTQTHNVCTVCIRGLAYRHFPLSALIEEKAELYHLHPLLSTRSLSLI